MYYSSGNYESFARPLKPKGVDGKSAFIIGTGLAALTAACFFCAASCSARASSSCSWDYRASTPDDLEAEPPVIAPPA